MTRQEKLVVLLISAVLFTRIGSLGLDLWFSSEFGAAASSFRNGPWRDSLGLITAIQGIAAAIWIYVEARATAARRFLWSLLGVFFGVPGIILFYAAQLYSLRQSEHSSEPTSLRDAD